MPRPLLLAPLSMLLALQLTGCLPGWSPEVLPVSADSSVTVVFGRVRIIRTAGDTLTGEGLTIKGDSTWLGRLEGGYQYIPREGILRVDHRRPGITSGALLFTAGLVAFVYLLAQSIEISPGGSTLVVGC